MIPLGVLASRRPAAGGGPVLTSTGTPIAGASATSVTTSVSLGTPAAGRQIVVVIAWEASLNRHITSVTIHGVSATADVSPGMSGVRCGLAVYRASVPTGATGDVVVTWNATGANWLMEVHASSAALTLMGGQSTSPDGSGTLHTATAAAQSGASVVGGCGVAGSIVAGSTGLGASTFSSDLKRLVGSAIAAGNPHVLTFTLSNSEPLSRAGIAVYQN